MFKSLICLMHSNATRLFPASFLFITAGKKLIFNELVMFYIMQLVSKNRIKTRIFIFNKVIFLRRQMKDSNCIGIREKSN